MTAPVAILGGGVAGLGLAYELTSAGIACVLLEQADQVGGHCITHQVEVAGHTFRFDSGAHRLHDRDAPASALIQNLLGQDMFPVDRPSRIYTEGTLITFPLRLGEIVQRLPWSYLLPAGMDAVRSQMFPARELDSFKTLAVRRYGHRLAERFLLRYTRKLWGQPCTTLDPSIAGKRLTGLRPMQVLRDLLLPGSRPAHLEGRFLYPRGGIGRLAEALTKAVGAEHIRCQARVTGVDHDGHRVRAVEINGGEVLPVSGAAATLPVDDLLAMLRPSLGLGGSFRYRHVLLVALFLKRPAIQDAASVYFPDPEFAFNRVYEPRNRCPTMSPTGLTSLVAEIACDDDSAVWRQDDASLQRLVADQLQSIGWIAAGDMVGGAVRRMARAYPVLDVGHRQRYAAAVAPLRKIPNLWLGGRNGLFAYSHIHDQLRWGRETAAGIIQVLS